MDAGSCLLQVDIYFKTKVLSCFIAIEKTKKEVLEET